MLILLMVLCAVYANVDCYAYVFDIVCPDDGDVDGAMCLMM